MKDQNKSILVGIVTFAVIAFTISSCSRDKVIEEVIIPKVEEKIEDVKEEVKDVEEEAKEALDKLDFGSAWRTMYDEHGEGHVFDWRDGLYTTDIADITVTTTE